MSKHAILLHLESGALFRDRDAIWRVDDHDTDNGNVLATRIAEFNVNNTGELMFRESGAEWAQENYNGYNEVVLVAGIYEVLSNGLRSPNIAGEVPSQDAIRSKQIASVMQMDPDSGGEVELAIFKMESGAMVGLDASFIEQEVGPLYSPYDQNTQLNIDA